MRDNSYDVNFSFVGVFALLLKYRKGQKEPFGVRVLLPGTEDRLSSLDHHWMIPGHTPFVAIPRAQHVTRPKHFAFRALFAMPHLQGINGCVETALNEEFVFYSIAGSPPKFKASFCERFSVNQKPVRPGEHPTCSNVRSLHWAADMSRYARDFSVVQPKFAKGDPDDVMDSWSYAEFRNGRMQVARLSTNGGSGGHVYRFTNSQGYVQPLADAVRILANLAEDTIYCGLPGGKVAVNGNGRPIDILIGSAPLDELTAPHPSTSCGVACNHHEVLYDFARCDADMGPHRKVSVPVCMVDHKGDRDPRLGHCVPFAMMYDQQTSAVRAFTSTKPAYSLHLGVDVYSQLYYETNDGLTPDSLMSAAFDAQTTADLAHGANFEHLPSYPYVLPGKAAKYDVVQKAIAEAVSKLNEAGGSFILSYAGYGIPKDFGKGWCLFDKVLQFTELTSWLSGFSDTVNVLVISDSCFSGRVAGVEFVGVRELPRAYASNLRQLHPDDFELGGMKATAIARLAERKRQAFLSACDDDETTPDGDSSSSNSPFTQCLRAGVEDSGVVSFAQLLHALQSCSGSERHPQLTPKKLASDYEKLGAFHRP